MRTEPALQNTHERAASNVARALRPRPPEADAPSAGAAEFASGGRRRPRARRCFEASWRSRSAMDELAHALGMDADRICGS